ncbi:MAG: PAS domain S-box protein [Anaerolineae bacterium]|nr:PAS domain S-box protein [Anaerolineae bacterium]
MRPFYRRLTFKIGVTIIVVELLVLVIVGYLLLRQFSRHFQADIEDRLLIPAAIVETNRGNLNMFDDEATIEQLVGAPVANAFVSSSNNIIINAIDSDLIGKRITQVAELNINWFTADSPHGIVLRDRDNVSTIVPIFTSDGSRPLFFVYVQASTAQYQAEEARLILVFVASAWLVVGLTSLILYLAIDRLALRRVTAVQQVLHTAQTGRLSVRIPLPIQDDEIGDLQHSANNLIDQLQEMVADLTQRIAEQRLTEAALRQSEEKYRDFVEGSHDLIVQIDKSGEFIYVNHAAERIYGLPQEALIGQSAFSFLHPDDQDRTEMGLLEWIRGNVSHATFENRQVSQTGLIFDTLWSINVHYDSYGNVNYINAIGRDITSRKTAEKQLQLQSSALAAAPTGILIADQDGLIEWINPAYTRLTGYILADIAGQHIGQVYNEDMAEPLQEAIWQTIQHGEIWQGEFTNQRKDGSFYAEEMTVTPVSDGEGNITHFIAIKQDFSQRQQAEAELRARASSLELIVRVGRRATAILSLDDLLHESVNLISSTFAYYNVVIRLVEGQYVVLKATSLASLKEMEGVARLKLGQGITGWVAQHGEALLAPDVLLEPRYHAELSKMETRSEVAVPIELKGIVMGVLDAQSVQPHAFDDDDLFTMQAIAAQLAVAIENARLYEAARQEILERRNAEERLQIYTAELERSNRELQNFAYVSSHDLQEPLRKIQMFSDRLAANYADVLDERGQDYLARMHNAAMRMQTLIVDLLAFSRVLTQADPFVGVNLTRTVQQVLEDLSVRIEEANGRIHLTPLPTVQADPTQMQQLFQNLLGNALKYHKPDEPPVVHIFAEKLTENRCQIVVQDNGIGFDEKYLDRIFTVFQRLHGRTEYEGTGIGLAICRLIVERHGGDIIATSQPGQGATFIVTLPIKQNNNGQLTIDN